MVDDLALAEGVVERVVDLRGRDAEPRRACRGRSSTIGLAGRCCCWSVLTSVSSGSCFSASASFGAHVVEVGEVVALQRVLVLRVALPAADAHVLHRPAGTALAPGTLRELAGAAARSPGRPTSCARSSGFSVDEHEAASWRCAAAGEADDGRRPPDRCCTMSTNWRSLPLHRLERDALVGAACRRSRRPGVLLREEALRAR